MRTSRRDVRGQYSAWGSRSLPQWPYVGAALLMLAMACVSPEMRQDTGRGTLTQAHGAPDWVGEPLDWGKLERIGQWLERDAANYDVYWRVQAELTLGEGRLHFARLEASQAAPDSKSWMARLQGARSGLQRVVNDSRANDIQTRRARNALAEIEGLRGLALAEAPSTSSYLSRASWRAKAPMPSRLNPTVGGYDRITIHHTADVPGVRFDGSLSDSISAVQKVQRNHMETRAYGDIGYHFLIDANGRVFDGRDLRFQGAHAGGQNNLRNIGVCLIGNFEHSRPSGRAMAALQQVLIDLRRDHNIRRSRIVGHGELKSTACPGTSLARWTRDYRQSGPPLSQLAHAGSSGKTQILTASAPPAARRFASQTPATAAPRPRTRSVVR